MKKEFALIGAGGIGVALLGLWLFQSSHNPVNDQESVSGLATDVGLETHSDIETKAVPTTAHGNSATETVMGIEVRKNRNCDIERRYIDLGNGTVVEAFTCVPRHASTRAYEDIGIETLEVMAYDDWQAASVLGKRLVETDLDKSRQYLLRAVALRPDNLDPVMWLSAQVYSLRGDTLEAKNAIANNYVLARTAKLLGSKTDIDWIAEELREAGFDDADFVELERGVQDNLQYIRKVQIEVFGESFIEGASS